MRQFPERVIWPGVLISLTVLSVNYMGDGLRDALDPASAAAERGAAPAPLDSRPRHPP
jgi:hypothetical protein